MVERRPRSEERSSAPVMDRERIARMKEVEKANLAAANGPIDTPFLILVLLLTGIGLIMVFSASFPSAYYENGNPAHYFIRQGIFAIMGLAAMVVVSRINYQRFRGLAKLSILGAIILLVLVLIIGIKVNNARRWLGFGSLTFQPSEIAKIAVVLYFADSISKKKDRMQDFRAGIVPYAIVLGIIAILMMLEPHFSGTMLILGVGAILLIVGGIPTKWIAGVAAVGAAGIYLVLGVFGYGASRISMWLDPWQDALGDGYQMCQSLLAIGSGGLLGVGLGRSRQKFLYLPEEHNDFIFAIVCEELGLVGATIIMVLFAALILRGFWIALHARDRFGTLLVVGVISLIAMQTFLNIAVVTGFVPATGISLPFFSYGGTALFMQLAEMGIVLSVSRQMRASKAE
ncbi:MAG: putative lipid II flippase FtsW [Oscillospiraceae bacterium]|nr:putative lipid II flippase FtsW [Oscillospiraceae bacterium]